MHTVFALLCFVVVIHWLIFPYPSGLLHWHCGNLTIAPVPAKQPWWIWINTSSEFILNDCITTTKQSTTKPCAYFLGCTVRCTIRGLWSQEQLFLWHVQAITSHKHCMWDYLSMPYYTCFWHHIPHMSKYNAPLATSTKYLGIFLVRFSYNASFIFALWHCYVYVLLFLA